MTELDVSKLQDVIENIFNTIVNLPKPIRRVCYVQVFAFMGWCTSSCLSLINVINLCAFRFPFLFYSYVILFFSPRSFPLMYLLRTTYVGQVMAYEHNKEPDTTLAVRKGEFAMLLYSIGMQRD